MGKSPAFRFYPADFLGSPDVQSMDLNEIGAYILLLCIAWQQDRHGCLPDDENRLRRWARMNPEQWSMSREILLGKFPVVESGLRGNPRMIREAEKQAEFSAKQSNNGKQGGRPKKKAMGYENKPVAFETKASENPEPPEIKPSVSAFVSVSASVLDSVSVSEEKASTLALTPDGVHAGDLIPQKKVTDPRNRPFKEALKNYYEQEAKMAMTWSPSEGKQFSDFLAANPLLTLADFETILNHRAGSEVKHSERPRKWLPNATSYLNSPLDRYNKPLGGNTNGKSAQTLSSAQRFHEKIIREEAMAQQALGSGGTDETGPTVGRLLP